MITTKCWEGDWEKVLKNPKGAEIVVGNNLKEPDKVSKAFKSKGIRFYMAEGALYDEARQCYQTDFEARSYPFSASELIELYLAKDQPVWVHYASDVTPPKTDWISEAMPMIDEYFCVSPAQHPDFEWPDNQFTRSQPFGAITQMFSDHAFVMRPQKLKAGSFNHDNSAMLAQYPDINRSGQCFEVKLGLYMASTDNWRAILKDHIYEHQVRQDKN